MEVRHLRLVQAVGHAGSLAAASTRLHLTEAEDQLGTALFVRTGKRLVATPAGERVKALADEVLARIDTVEGEPKAASTGERGLIRLSTGCYTSYHWLPSTRTSSGRPGKPPRPSPFFPSPRPRSRS